MTEHQLQHQCVLWFSQEFPKLRGTLFSVNNEAANNKHAMKLKATGVIPGVSDLIFIEDGCMVGLELKTIGSRHDKNHIQQQYDWGMAIESAGGEYHIVKSFQGFKDVIMGLHGHNDDVLSLRDIAVLLETNNKTIVF